MENFMSFYVKTNQRLLHPPFILFRWSPQSGLSKKKKIVFAQMVTGRKLLAIFKGMTFLMPIMIAAYIGGSAATYNVVLT
jgi:hypothetical protein